MSEPIRSAVVVGGGSAGFLAATTFRRMLPQVKLTVVYSPDIPVIGVGESTTPATPLHVHEILGIDRGEFHREVRPSWKMGLRFEWGASGLPHFNYTFDTYLDKQVRGLGKWAAFYCLADNQDSSDFQARMDRDKAPTLQRGGQVSLDPRATYHLPNTRFIDFLQRRAQAAGATLLADEVVGVTQAESGDVASLRLKSGRDLSADLFIDCSGFGSQLLGKTLDEPWLSYQDTLYCDRAVIGSWERDDLIRPYTTVSTMDHGWAWRIDFPDVVTRGYVFSSAFCSDEDAAEELKRKNPEFGDDPDLRVLRFPSGRYQRNWVRNVLAVGNASGFVEPLEATSLHLIIEQLYNFCWAMTDADARPGPDLHDLLNHRFALVWDDVRDFLALHYKFNHHSDTPFWRHCREETPLGGAADMVEAYGQIGPSRLLGNLLPGGGMFGYGGYMSMLVGMQVPTEARSTLSDREARVWRAHRDGYRKAAAVAPRMRPALAQVHRGA